MLRWQAKMVCGIIMFIAMPICFLLPVKMSGIFRRWGSRGQRVLDLLTCFAGGVFLASYLVFMAPAVRVLIEENLMKPNRIEFPLPDMIIGLGFFAMMMLDKLVKTISKVTRRNKRERHRDQYSPDSLAPIETGSITMNSELYMESNGKAFALNQSDSSSINEQANDGNDDSETEMDMTNIGVVLSPNRVSVSRPTSQQDAHEPPFTRQQSLVEAAAGSTESLTRSIVMMLALSIDSILEGMTIGLKRTTIEVWAIFIGIIVHESVIAFCLGLQLVRIHRSRLPVILASVVYTLMNPLGVIVATLIYESMEFNQTVELANGVLQALTSGCFIYVIFYEILEGQITQDTPCSKIVATFVGYVFLGSFAAIPGSGSYAYHHVTLDLAQNLSAVCGLQCGDNVVQLSTTADMEY